ncbi:hypothetical protein [Cryobacterium sp.]|jgi:hypothetical protein|uniref:hypothetical protein n=1 Tax=Cryobacterium sp. TaxID=1926290 RepID=UPI002637A8B2|nr:hypothetical protein [Cryobacterium sp.]
MQHHEDLGGPAGGERVGVEQHREHGEGAEQGGRDRQGEPALPAEVGGEEREDEQAEVAGHADAAVAEEQAGLHRDACAQREAEHHRQFPPGGRPVLFGVVRHQNELFPQPV